MTVPHACAGRACSAPPAARPWAGPRSNGSTSCRAGPSSRSADLSGGNQQKVVMARALADEPRLLVLMAPTAGVDIKSKQSLMTAAAESARRRGRACWWSATTSTTCGTATVSSIMFRGRVVGELPAEREDQQLVAAMEGMELTT